jgi:hypothetical protein
MLSCKIHADEKHVTCQGDKIKEDETGGARMVEMRNSQIFGRKTWKEETTRKI